ncbi:MAG: protocatechuate 3,4-dioxygenase subunit beta [Pseudomonadota bacterium]
MEHRRVGETRGGDAITAEPETGDLTADMQLREPARGVPGQAASGVEHQSAAPSAEYFQRDRSAHPPALTPDYKTSVARSPRLPLISLQNSVSEITGPVFGPTDIDPGDKDLLTNYAQPGESPIGERIILHGRVLDESARPVPKTLVEIWQANAGGRYRHVKDTYFAPIDPNFGGCGRTLTDDRGYFYFRTVKPGAYPWRNHINSWRPAHIHVSVFGASFIQRLITQCYFEGDPLIPICPIVQSIPDAKAIERLTAKLDLNATIPLDSIAYSFDIVLRGRRATLFENRLEG